MLQRNIKYLYKENCFASKFQSFDIVFRKKKYLFGLFNQYLVSIVKSKNYRKSFQDIEVKENHSSLVTTFDIVNKHFGFWILLDKDEVTKSLKQNGTITINKHSEVYLSQYKMFKDLSRKVIDFDKIVYIYVDEYYKVDLAINVFPLSEKNAGFPLTLNDTTTFVFDKQHRFYMDNEVVIDKLLESKSI